MKSQARKLTTGDSKQTFTIFFKDGRMLAVQAASFVAKATSDMIDFYSAPGILNTQIFLELSTVACIVSSADLAEVPAFLEMQSQIQQILSRLSALERPTS